MTALFLYTEIMIRILFLLVTLMSFSAKADMDVVCILGNYGFDDHDTIIEDCRRNNIVDISFNNPLTLHTFILSYCRFDRNVVVTDDNPDREFNKHLSCVLYSREGRIIHTMDK